MQCKTKQQSATLQKQHGQHICSVITASENVKYREVFRSLIATDKRLSNLYFTTSLRKTSMFCMN